MQYISQKARFSRCRRYRYSLERSWKLGEGRALFIGLNPSTADHRHDDPTIRRCVGFAKSWGYEAMEIVNLFAFRATYPSDLKRAVDPIGPANNRWLSKAIKRSDIAICCWGNDGDFMNRSQVIINRYPDLHCLKINSTAHPAHPLYLRANLTPFAMPSLGSTTQ
ncbi:MAG: DUF1643 domain-containing protein [Pseudohongiellaceae bacterium]